MATNRKFNARHGLSTGTGTTLKDIVSESGLVFDVGQLSTLKTTDKDDTVSAINELYDFLQALNTYDETFEPMGVSNRAHSVISFNNTTKVLSLAVASGQTEFIVWTKGDRRVYTTTQTVSIGATPATGLYYIYFDANGVLSSKTSEYIWSEDTPVACVYWNSSTSTAEFVSDERHGTVLDWATHEYLHKTQGAKVASGFELINYTTAGTGSSDSDTSVGMSNGVFFDEDLKVSITHNATPVDCTFTQVLQSIARIPVLYQSGAGGSWVKNTASDFPVKYNTSERIQYNVFSGGTWNTSQVDSGKYAITWVFASSDIYSPVIGILGQSQYSSVTEAEAAIFSDLALSNFPVTEFRPLWKLIYETSSSYTNTTKSRLVKAADLRQISSGITGKTVSDHGLLSGLSDDDHTQYVHTSVNRTITASHTITGNLELSGGLKDRLSGLGTAGQYLVSTGNKVEWKFPSTTNIIYVSKDGNDANTGSSLQNAKATIKSALTLATPGTTIKVSAGVYNENNPLFVPKQVSIVGDSLREVTVTPLNSGNLFYVTNGNYVSNMSFVGSPNTGAIFSFDPSNPPYISQSPYIQNCTNFIPNSKGLYIDGDHCIGPLKSMVVDSYTQFNQGGVGVDIRNEAYAQLVSMFTICCDTAVRCQNGGGCDLTNSNSSFGNYGLVASGVSPLKYRGTISEVVPVESSVIKVNTAATTFSVLTATYNKANGELLITTTANHGLLAGADVKVENLLFSCDSGSGPSTQTFPSGNYGNIFTIKQVPSASQMLMHVGSSDFDHNYVSGGTVKVDVVRPFDGQVLHFNTLYYQVLEVKVISGGSGYTSDPTVSFSSPSAAWGIKAQAVSEVVNGQLRSIELISAGRGYTSTPPTITISPPTGGGAVPAVVQVVMVAEYYLVSNSEEVSPNVYRVELKSPVPFSIPVSENVYFYKQSRLLASSHSFEYIGSGTNINAALPRKGGVPIQENETVSDSGGIVIYTSTDHSGNFRIGDGVIIDQTLGRISGDFYSRSLFSTMTPFILALGA